MTDPEPQKNPWEFMEQAAHDEEPQSEAAATEEPSQDVEDAAVDAATDDQPDTTPSAEADGDPADDGESGTTQQPVAEADLTTEQDASAGSDDPAAAAPTTTAVVESDAEAGTDEAGDNGDADASGDEAANGSDDDDAHDGDDADGDDDAHDGESGDAEEEAEEDSTDEVVEITEDENWSSRYTAQYGEEEVRELASDLEHHICSTAGGLMLLALPLFPAFQMANSWAPNLRAYNTLMGYAIVVVFWFTCVWGFFRLTMLFARLGPDYSRWFSRAMVVAVLINLIWMAKWMNDQANYGW